LKALVVYSGGLDTTVCIPVLKSEGYDVVHTVTVDVGQPAADVAQAEERAKILGAIQTTVDAKQEFADDFCTAAIAMNADYFGYPLSTAIARPLIAKKAADEAAARDAEAKLERGRRDEVEPAAPALVDRERLASLGGGRHGSAARQDPG